MTLEPYGILSVSEGVPFNMQHDGKVFLTQKAPITTAADGIYKLFFREIKA